ncbi:MAG: Serine/threonine-protein kinase PknD [Phycisphaerae bacterium]|nr:Serine/threonine-protein kinase PknD [Phycisphaerae bacterium]
MVSESAQKPPARVACPACKTIYQINTALLGKKLICARCKTEWNTIAPETLVAAGDQVSDVDAELMDLADRGEKTKSVGGSLAAPSHDYWLGKSIGRYQIRSILGVGALGYVYRGHDKELGRDVAIKILAKPKGEQMTLREKLFIQEARAAARLQHPNIVTIHEVGVDGDFYYFAMEVVDGGTLKDLVLALGKLSAARASFLVAQAAQALAYAHGKGVIHRDIKPDNLMMDQRGVIRVADFGLAEIGEIDLIKLFHGRPFGTPGYIAPEMARGEGSTPQSDIYCLGLVLYYALTGRKMLKADGAQAQVELCARPPVFEPGPELADVPAECLRILQRCLEHEPTKRYPKAQQLADDLRRFVVESSRDDSHSQLPLPGPDPFTGQLSRPQRGPISRLLLRTARFLSRRPARK